MASTSRKTWIIFVSFVNPSADKVQIPTEHTQPCTIYYQSEPALRYPFTQGVGYPPPRWGPSPQFSVFYISHFPFSFLEFPLFLAHQENCSLFRNLLNHTHLSPTCRTGTGMRPPSLLLCSADVHCSLTRVGEALCFVLDSPPG